MKLSPERKSHIRAQIDDAQILMLDEAVSVSISGDQVSVTFKKADHRQFRDYYFHVNMNGKHRDAFRYPINATPSVKTYTVGPTDTFLFKAHLEYRAYVLFTLRETPAARIYVV